jgi:hypothetical protein
MIIAERHGFAFVHIPKCAGSSLRQQIEVFDEENSFFSRVKHHPVLGPVDYGHFTLAELREHFPDRYEKLLRLDCYAVARDPLDRFGSALRQTLFMYDKRPMTLIPRPELINTARRVVDELDASFDRLPTRYVFFTPQTRYVFDQGERVVTRVYPIEATSRFIAEIAARIGAPLDTGRRSNQNVDLKVKALGPALFRVNAALKAILPDSTHAGLRRLVLPLVARKESAASALRLADEAFVQDFVSARYADDLALHRDALREMAATNPVAAADA